MAISHDDLLQKVRDEQSAARFEHSCAVSRLAGELAGRHGWSPDEARRAGLLHDWAKEWSPRRLVIYVKSNRLKVPALPFIVQVSPNLLHAYVGADLVAKKGWISGPDSKKAIASHTLGNVPMTLAEKILYVADLASYDRGFKEAPDIRSHAFENLDAGFRESVSLKMSYQLRKGKPIHPMALKVWNSVICKAVGR